MPIFSQMENKVREEKSLAPNHVIGCRAGLRIQVSLSSQTALCSPDALIIKMLRKQGLPGRIAAPTIQR